ncbi:hypothetical protein FNV43_RR11489 [Rhamnella rubrinervis]|uniref:Uncharacterized protein n=1 Tax=Rhamnella rubrinervis TaxID=2594499 RepID=A0A8K0H6E0_9ROSA|nr:hypothetical protein FNV43_RR11489 [Rhamnella rubrinervis]
MGKKKPQKTKELSVAIAEASSASAGDETQKQPQPQTPRKRGRPRKIIENIPESSTEEKKEDQPPEIDQQVDETEAKNLTEGVLKKVKIFEQNEEQVVVEQEHTIKLKEEGSSQKEEGQSIEIQFSREPPRRRARRKSKPRKSS